MGIFIGLIGCDSSSLERMVKRRRIPNPLSTEDLAEALVWEDHTDDWLNKRQNIIDGFVRVYRQSLDVACREGVLSFTETEVHDWTGELVNVINYVRIEDYCKYDPDANFCKLFNTDESACKLSKDLIEPSSSTKQQRREAVLVELLEDLGFKQACSGSPIFLNKTKIEMVQMLNQKDRFLFPTKESYETSPHTFNEFWKTQKICTLAKNIFS